VSSFLLPESKTPGSGPLRHRQPFQQRATNGFQDPRPLTAFEGNPAIALGQRPGSSVIPPKGTGRIRPVAPRDHRQCRPTGLTCDQAAEILGILRARPTVTGFSPWPGCDAKLAQSREAGRMLAGGTCDAAPRPLSTAAGLDHLVGGLVPPLAVEDDVLDRVRVANVTAVQRSAGTTSDGSARGDRSQSRTVPFPRILAS
jgi:hypothetical protein